MNLTNTSSSDPPLLPLGRRILQIYCDGICGDEFVWSPPKSKTLPPTSSCQILRGSCGRFEVPACASDNTSWGIIWNVCEWYGGHREEIMSPSNMRISLRVQVMFTSKIVGHQNSTDMSDNYLKSPNHLSNPRWHQARKHSAAAFSRRLD
jgi:hypothetical protein